MLARNPKTGATIRVMKSDVSLWKNRKTLIWVDRVAFDVGDKWDTARVGPGDATMVVLTGDGEKEIAWLKTQQAKATRFILVPLSLVKAVGEDKFANLGLGNVLCLDELHTMYPYLGAAWDGTIDDALVMAAVLFRYSRLVGLLPDSSERLKTLPLEVNLEVVRPSEAQPPEPLVLIQQFYKPAQAKRARELTKCLKKNLENPYVSKIVLFMEDASLDLPADPSGKIAKVPLKTRVTYWDCLQAIKNHIGPGNLVALANTDIYLDASWRAAWSADFHDVCAALLRYEEDPTGSDNHKIFGPRADSQDTWLLHSDSVMSREWKEAAFQIPFGQAGCDNAILVEFLRQKFRITNPAMTLRTIHVHSSAVRTYDPHNVVDRPVYMHVEPTGIHELDPVLTWTGWADKPAAAGSSFDRPLAATNPKMIATFCSQMNRDPTCVWSAEGLNTYAPPEGQERMIALDGGAFVGPSGLVYKHAKLLVGASDRQKEVWGANNLGHLMPAQLANTMIAFPLEGAWLDEPGLYVLKYLSRVLSLHFDNPDASFWCKQTPGLLSAFKLFKWEEKRGHLVRYDPQTQVFAPKVIGRTSHGVRVMPRDVEALREAMYGGWEAKPSGNKMVIIGDTVHLKDAVLNELEAAGVAAGYDVKVVWAAADAALLATALVGASRVVLSTSAKVVKIPSWSWLWMVPTGCEVLELQEDREPSDELVHLSAAAGLKWTLLQYPRSTPDGFRKFVVEEAKKWLVTGKATPPKPSGLPVVYTPPASMKFGFFGHRGDSFREMIDLWAKAGYVQRKEDPSLTQCWLGGPGKALLYDRPTWDWIEKAPAAEKVWKHALVGNPEASGRPDAQPWIFWPRQPALVERLVSEGVPQACYAYRKDDLVFFGRVENEKQGAFRQEADVEGWRAACSQFSMPVGAKEPYALSPEAYLRALAGAKFGLCLRGFGPKCNREIELLAMGCVPVVTPGVDYTGYANPLVDGVHVIVAATPEEAKEKMAALDADAWAKMSTAGRLWWHANASVDGSWKTTVACLSNYE